LGRRRRRKIVRVLRRRIPKIFVCPVCGKRAVTVSISKETGIAHIACGSCGVSGDVQVSEGMTSVDAYCTWYDEVISKGVEIPLEPGSS